MALEFDACRFAHERAEVTLDLAAPPLEDEAA